MLTYIALLNSARKGLYLLFCFLSCTFVAQTVEAASYILGNKRNLNVAVKTR